VHVIEEKTYSSSLVFDIAHADVSLRLLLLLIPVGEDDEGNATDW
jgi:hypothetical protein